MAGRLEGRRILVTGAASGMGRGIAERFRAEGAALALLDRNGDGAQAVAAAIGAVAYACDVSRRDEVNAVVAQAADALGGLDGVVNAAGILDTKPFGDLAPESWDRMIAVNLTGPADVIRAALPFLRAGPGASIVNIASVSGLMPMDGTTGYSASKAGLIMLTRCLGLDLGPAIRVNAICPGVIATEMTKYILDNPEHADRAAQRVALKRIGQVDDVANTALFLISDESGFTTGAWFPVDGGFAWR